MARIATLLILGALALSGQADRNRLGLPNPPKPDIPYLIHGSDIRELEQVDAAEEITKNQLRYWIAGPAAAIRTPLAAPEFLFDSQLIDPRDLTLFGFEVKNGRRELLYRKKKKVVAEPYFLNVEGVAGRVIRIRINASLPPGEYGITPDGQNIVFTFSVF
ncbi:MAG: hypothetical protein F4Y47_12975 [Acidobacteriia bacterium]|nr:hypothetical protein [Terriglobia bacterium]MYG04719.1 hypothetical protein [Terriglobia bacterium]MYK11630.1 hypothetical protein [Terriglobia bacterium]